MADSGSGSGLTSWLPVIGAGLDFGSQILGGLFSANQAKKNRAFQERMYNQQVQDNINFWKMNNEYNLPSAVMQRMTDANINPYLAFEGGASAFTSSQMPQAGTAPHGDSAQQSWRTNFGQALQQAALIDAQIQNINADTKQKEANASNVGEMALQNRLMRDMNIAIRYRDYDFLNQSIAESQNRIFQSSFVNANEMAALSLSNTLAIKHYNLSEYQVGQNVLQGWEMVANGRIAANASMRSAFAQMMQARTAAQIAPAQIGYLRSLAANMSEQTKFLQDTHGYRSDQLYYQSQMARKDLSWKDLLYESNLDEQQSRIFLNNIQGTYTNTLNEYKPIDAMMTPFNMLTGFGAGVMMNGNYGRTVVKGFGQ